MFFLISVFKIILILVLLLLAATPFLIEYAGYKKEKENDESYKRFRLFLYAVLYTLVLTVVLFILKEFFVWVDDLRFLKKLASFLSIPKRIPYTVKLFGAILLNIVMAWGFLLLLPIVKSRLKKLDLVSPKGKDGNYTFLQELERKLIKKLCTPTGMFAAEVLKYFAAIVSAVASLTFVVYLLPALWGGKWIPYGFISAFFSSSYVYPVLTLFVLWEAYFFLAGVCMAQKQCPQLIDPAQCSTVVTGADIAELRTKCKEEFGDFFMSELDAKKDRLTKAASVHTDITNIIAEGIEHDERNPQTPKENYLVAMDRVVRSEKSILFKGGFFSEFSMYFLRYLSVVVARGDNIIFVCNDNEQIKNVEKYLTRAFSETVSVYTDPADNKYDAPIWKIVTVDGDKSDINQGGVDNCSILITTLNYICSEEFENGHGGFVYHLDSVVFTDTLNTVNKYYAQMLMLNSKLKHMTDTNAVDAKNVRLNPNLQIHYMSRQVRYFCFDGNDNPGIDKTLQSMLTVDFEAVDATCSCEQTMVCCCRMEGKLDENGNRIIPQMLNAENMGMILNLAVYCAMSGANSVSIFADGLVPYANYMESLNWNLGQAGVNLDGCIEVNSPKYNPDGYRVIIGVDANDNLPAAIRKYRDLASDKPTLLIIIARNYLFRDYYAANIETLWESCQIERIPFIENSDDDIVRKILIKANSGGITEEELYDWASKVDSFKEYVKDRDAEAILRAILRMYDLPDDDKSFYLYFEYTTINDFDKNGDFSIATRIELRREGQLFEFISGRDWITMHDGDDRVPLQIPKNRICQNFIEGQNFLHRGNIYTVLSVDKLAGVIVAMRAAAGTNIETYFNVQAREYVVEYSEDKLVYLDAPKHAAVSMEENGVRVDGVHMAMFRAPMEVITKGYYTLNNFNPSLSDDTPGQPIYYSICEEDNAFLSRYAYRKYGEVENSVDQESITDVPITAYQNGALMLSLKIGVDLGDKHDKAANLLSVMLSETLRSMFPSVADSVVIAPLLHGEPDPEFANVLNRYPKLTIKGDPGTEGLEILIIEDCVSDLGVVSILKHDGSELFKTLFSRVYEYLDWYMNAEEKSDYLKFGRQEELSCFDFEAVYGIARILGKPDFKPNMVNSDKLVRTVVCDFCMKRFQQGVEMTKLDDGRMMCPECAAKVITDKRELKAMLNSAKTFLESSYGITLDDEYEFCFETALKIANTVKSRTDLIRRGVDVPLNSYIDRDKRVHVEYDIPEVNFSELLVRELTHVWQLKNVPDCEEALAEGHIALVSVQYLNYIGRSQLACARKNYYESYKGITGEGYRRLVLELVAHPEFNNNPFAYLLGGGGGGGGTEIEKPIVPPKPPKPQRGEDFGKPYKPENPTEPDRETNEEATYFYYSQLSGADRDNYMRLLEGIKGRQENIQLPGCASSHTSVIMNAVLEDHPEIFYILQWKFKDGEISPVYCASQSETEMLQRRIDEAVQVYLKQINDSMSAYEVALKLHCAIIDNVDYDTAKLNEEDRNGGRDINVIDRIRSMVGVFVDKKAVCAGYAHAFTYLMRKCGIMCASVGGKIHRGGGGHAWNIIKLDGDFYYLDATWDDASTTVQAVKSRDIGYSYFAITTEELVRTRSFDNDIMPMPECIATRCNYYVHNDLVIDRFDIEAIKEMATRTASGKDPFFTFKCKTRAVFDECVSRLFISDGWGQITKAAAKVNKSIDPLRISHSKNDDIYTITLYYVKK